MNFALTETQRMLRDTCREFAQKELAPHARRWDEAHGVPAATIRPSSMM